MKKCQDLEKEIRRLWKLRDIEIVLVVIEDEKARHNMKCWSNAKDCLVRNCKNTELSKYDDSILLAFGDLLQLA